MTAPRLSPSDLALAVQAAVLTRALQEIRHANTEPPLPADYQCSNCIQDGIRIYALVYGAGWELRKRG